MLSDYIKVSNIATESMLYSEADLEASMEKIETINFHEERDVMGVRFWAYNGEWNFLSISVQFEKSIS